MAHLPTIRQLQYLLALSETLHFGKASEKVFVSQSTFSTGIAELETHLNAKLVERNNRQVTFTASGLQVVEKAKQILDLSEQILQLSEETLVPFHQSFKLAIIPSILPFIIRQLAQAIQQDFDNPEFYTLELQTEDALEQLRHKTVDAVLMALPYDTQEFHTQIIATEPLYWVGKKELAKQLKLSQKTNMQQLSYDKLLTLEEGHCLTEHTLRACPKNIGLKSPQPKKYQQLSIVSLFSLILAGEGYGFLPEMAIHSSWLKHESLQQLLLIDAPERQFALVNRKTNLKEVEVSYLTQLFAQIFCQGELS